MKNTDAIKSEYKNLYGTEISYPDSDFGSCPVYTYDKANDSFYVSSGCGGSGYPTGYIYKYKFAKSDDTAYVYFAVGGQAYSDDEVSGDIYYDFIDEPSVKTAPSNKTKLQGIDSSNYQDFAHYRLVFSNLSPTSIIPHSHLL